MARIFPRLVARLAGRSFKKDMMNFLKRLFGIRPDPTREWPRLPASTPAIDLRDMTAGPLSFTSTLPDARPLGRPDQFTQKSARFAVLFYARAGYSLDFVENRLDGVEYFVGAESYHPEHPAFALAKLSVISHDGTRHELHAGTNAEALVAAFGKPGRADVGEDESLLEWEHRGVLIEAELDARGRLEKLNLFPND
jgi:hypothetical protein